MAHRGSLGIHAGRPTPQNLLSASREGWQIKIKNRRGGQPAGLFGSRVLRNLCSRCRGTKAAFGLVRHCGAAVVKPDAAVGQVILGLRFYDRFALDRSLARLVSDYRGNAPTSGGALSFGA